MATRYKHRRSNTTGAVPTSLEEGELALNIYDGKLFYGKAGGTVGEIATGSADLTNYARTDQAETFEGYVSIEFDPTQGNLALLAPDTTGLPDGITAIGSLDFKTHDGATALAGMYALTNMTAGEQGTPVLTLYSQGDIDFSVPNGSIVSVGGSEVLTVDSSLDYLKLNITGIPDGTKFLRDDGAWALPPGDMAKATYDTNDSGVIDNAEALGGVAAANYAQWSDLQAGNAKVSGALNTATGFSYTIPPGEAVIAGIIVPYAGGTYTIAPDTTDMFNVNASGTIIQAPIAFPLPAGTAFVGLAQADQTGIAYHDTGVPKKRFASELAVTQQLTVDPLDTESDSFYYVTVSSDNARLEAANYEQFSYGTHLQASDGPMTFNVDGAETVFNLDGTVTLPTGTNLMLKTDTAQDSAKLGGVAAASYALKSELGGTVTTRTVTASATILSTDGYVFASATGGNVVLTLPDASTTTKTIPISRTDLTGANTLRLLPVNGQTIDGDADAFLRIRTSVELVPLAGNWRVV